MWERPRFLDLPRHEPKPRDRGLTHVLDKGAPLPIVEGVLANSAQYIDIVKIGWGLAYLDATLRDRVSLYQSAGIAVSLGGTLIEIAAAQGRVDELRRWALDVGIDTVEVSNGLCLLTSESKTALIADLQADFDVLAEAGAKDAEALVSAAAWLSEMRSDLDAGARRVIAEGRESGTVGLYEPDGLIRELLVEELVESLPLDLVIFEAPRKSQQAWFIRRFGPNINLGNISLGDVLPLETLRLGLRADTAATAVTR